MKLEVRDKLGVKLWFYDFTLNRVRYRGWLLPPDNMTKRQAMAEVNRVRAEIDTNTSPITRRNGKQHTVVSKCGQIYAKFSPRGNKMKKTWLGMAVLAVGLTGCAINHGPPSWAWQKEGVAPEQAQRQLDICNHQARGTVLANGGTGYEYSALLNLVKGCMMEKGYDWKPVKVAAVAEQEAPAAVK